MLQPKCRQPYVHNSNNVDCDVEATPELPPRPPLPRSPSSVSKDLEKQQQLSDWYYIKSGPKSPLPPPRPDKHNSEPSTKNKIDGIFVKNKKFNPRASRDCTKNNINIYNQNIKRDDNCNFQFKNKNIDEQINGDIAAKKCENDIEVMKSPPHCEMQVNESHNENSTNELLCKFNARNNNEKVNGFSQCSRNKQQQHQFSHQQYYEQLKQYQHHSTSPSPHQEKRMKHFVNQDEMHQQLFDKQSEFPSELHHYQEVMHSPNDNSNRTNGNLNNIAVFHQPLRLPLPRYGEVSSSSFEHVNVSSFLSSSSSTEMTIPEKKQFTKSTGNFTDEQHLANKIGDGSSSGGSDCFRQTTVSQPFQRRRTPPPIPTRSPLNQHKVSKNFSFFF